MDTELTVFNPCYQLVTAWELLGRRLQVVVRAVKMFL